MKTKWILIFLRVLIECIFNSLRDMEKSGYVDSDGVPLSEEYKEEYYKQGFILAKLREITYDSYLNSENYEN